jgi:hypothetical protein
MPIVYFLLNALIHVEIYCFSSQACAYSSPFFIDSWAPMLAEIKFDSVNRSPLRSAFIRPSCMTRIRGHKSSSS